MKQLTIVQQEIVDADAIEIGDLYQRAKSSVVDGVRYAIEAGGRLKKKKAELSHGEWLPWLEDNATVLGFEAAWTAQRLMAANTKYHASVVFDDKTAIEASRTIWGHNDERERKEKRRQELAAIAALQNPCGAQFEIHNKPCLGVLNGEANSVDWIVTDPPYPKEFLEAYSDLGKVAAHALKPGGSLLCMTGSMYLPDVISRLANFLNYHWVLAYLTPGGQAAQIFPRKVNQFWKPVLWFVKGEYAGDWIGDVARSDVNDNDKRFHEWGQSESGMRDIMQRFVCPGQSVLDPFMGAGTTGVIALELGARFFGFDTNIDAYNEAIVRLNSAAVVA